MIPKLRAIDRDSLFIYFEMEDNQDEEDYYKEICEWISDKFVGYSIYHVSGRFRTNNLRIVLDKLR